MLSVLYSQVVWLDPLPEGDLQLIEKEEIAFFVKSKADFANCI
jgi:hypothetical protein